MLESLNWQAFFGVLGHGSVVGMIRSCVHTNYLDGRMDGWIGLIGVEGAEAKLARRGR